MLFDALGVGVGAVNLVDCEYDRHTCRLRVADGFLGLGHHRIVGRNHDDGDVGNLGSTRTHCGKGLVTWRIQKGNVLSVGKLNAVGADVLRDSTRFTCNYVRLSDVVQKRRLTVVDVTHYSNNRGSWYEFGIVF